jgi:phage protein U
MIGAIGCKEMGDIIMFEVSDDKIFTFSDFSRSNSVNYADTQVLQKKPLSQYVGESLDEITFKIKLKDYFGVDPRTEMNKLIYIQRDGTVISFVLDGKGFGRYRWTIRELKMDFAEIDGQGGYHCVDLSVTLKEYARGSEVVKSANRYK